MPTGSMSCRVDIASSGKPLILFEKKGRRSSGLGLPFVQEVARLHDGRASLDDRDGGGTVASLWLPLAVPGQRPRR